jgi:hypothetical protein
MPHVARMMTGLLDAEGEEEKRGLSPGGGLWQAITSGMWGSGPGCNGTEWIASPLQLPRPGEDREWVVSRSDHPAAHVGFLLRRQPVDGEAERGELQSCHFLVDDRRDVVHTGSKLATMFRDKLCRKCLD